MDFASLRAKLDNIAEELAQLPEQETVAVEEDHHEKDEDGNVIPHDKIEEVEELSEFSPADMAAANKDSKAVQKSGSGMKSTSAAKPQAAGTLAQRLKTEEVEEEEVEEEAVEEEAVEEAMVEIPVQELADIMQLAGYTDYAERIEEYANEPDEQYMDAEEQMIGLSGGLNGPKTMHTPAAGGDNPMDKEALKTVEENLYKSYKDFLEEAEIKED